MASPTIKLNNGKEMPQVGFGLWKVPNDVCADVVYKAVKAGYRLFDGACDYGNEVQCGQGIKRAIDEGLVTRDDLFIVSKLWNTFHDGPRVEPIARRQLADWGIDYFDLYLVHFPVALEYVDPAVRYPPGWHYDDAGTEIRPSRAGMHETWAAMESLVDAGLARAIGLSNFQAQLLYDVLRYARIRPAALQIEHHPYLVQPELLRVCAAEGVAVTAYSSLGPASFREFDMAHARALTPLLEEPTVVRRLAEKYGRDPGQILLRWATQRGLAVVPKSVREHTMKSNLDVVGWDIEDEDIQAISGLDKNIRFNQPSNYFETDKLWIFA